jgi:hypothetical protein
MRRDTSRLECTEYVSEVGGPVSLKLLVSRLSEVGPRMAATEHAVAPIHASRAASARQGVGDGVEAC